MALGGATGASEESEVIPTSGPEAAAFHRGARRGYLLGYEKAAYDFLDYLLAASTAGDVHRRGREAIDGLMAAVNAPSVREWLAQEGDPTGTPHPIRPEWPRAGQRRRADRH